MMFKRRYAPYALNFWPGFIEILAILILMVMFLTLIYGTAHYFIVQSRLSERAEPALSKQSQTLQIRLDDMRHAYQALQVEFDQARRGLQRQKDAIAKAADEADLTAIRLQAELEHLQAENRVLKQQNEEQVSSMRDRYIADLQQLEQDRNMLEEDRYDAVQANSAMQKRLALLVNENEVQAREIGNLESNLKAVRDEKHKLMGEIASLSTINANLEQEISDQRIVIEEFKTKHAHLPVR